MKVIAMIIFFCIFILPLLFFTDMIFATTLLQKAKTSLNSKNIHSSASPTNVMANDNSKSSCSNITNTVVFNHTIENVLHDNTTSDTENTSDTPDTGKFK